MLCMCCTLSRAPLEGCEAVGGCSALAGQGGARQISGKGEDSF